MKHARRPATWVSAWRSILAADHVRGYGLGCSFIPEDRPGEWFTLAADPRRFQLVHLELECGLEAARGEYNAVHVTRVRQSHRTLVGTRGGYQDLFVPVLDGRKLCGVLACGPVRTMRPTRAALRDEWAALRGRAASTDEDGFLRYARAALESHVFEGALFDALRRWFEAYAGLLAGARSFDRSLASAWHRREALRSALPELGMWPVATDLVTRDTNPLWTATFKGFDRLIEGITHVPTHVIGLLPELRTEEPFDAVERLVRVNSLQRAAATFAAGRADILAGRLSDEGAFLLVHLASSRRERSGLESVAERAAAFVRIRSGLDVAAGISERAGYGGELPDRYDEAVVAAKWALSERRRIAIYSDLSVRSARRPQGLYESSRSLCQSFDTGRVGEVSVGCERVVKEVMRLTGGSLEAARSHLLELLWEIATLVERRQIVDAVAVLEMRNRATEGVLRVRTLRELTTTFSDLVTEFARLLEPPRGVTLRVKLERARRFVAQDGYRRSIDFAALARRVGLSRSHLSRSFKQSYGIGLAQFVLEVRLEQSRRLLRESALNIAAVSHAAGFSSASYFHQAFRRAEGRTPEQYRASVTARASA